MTAVVSGKTINGTALKRKISALRIAAFATTSFSVLAIIIGCLTLAFNSWGMYVVPLLFIVAIAFTLLFIFVRHNLHNYQYSLIMLAVIALASAVIISALPGYWQGFNINGIINRSLVSGLLLLAVAVPGTCYALFYLVGVSPKSFDISRYPVLIFFAILGIIAYVLIIGYIVKNGTADLHWSLFTRPFQSQYKIIEEWQNGWPVFSSTEVKQIGMLNHITGTLLLMGLTSLISLPIGVSVGIFVYEYAGPKLGSVINFSTTALRSISGIILAVTALSVLSIPAKGTFLYNLFHGYGYDVNGVLQTGRSSFLFASVFVSLLVIPIIAKATQEGLNSLPADIREGSLAIGASKEHTLFHLQLPWSFPNIITGLMLGCAEAAGTLTIIFLIAGTGEFGVSPTNETTSLAYLIFDGRYGRALGDSVQDMMASYQYTAALSLLIITLGLTATALIMKRNLAKRYKGA